MSNVIPLKCVTTLPLSVEQVLDGAKGHIHEVVVIGHENDSRTLYCASSTSDLARILVMLKKAESLVVNLLNEMK